MTSEAIISAIRQRAAQGRRGLRRKPPKWQDPSAIEREYQQALRAYTDRMAELVNAILIPAMPAVFAEALGQRADSWVDRIESAVATIRLQMERETRQAEQLALDFGERVQQFNRLQAKRVAEATLGVNPFVSEPWLADELRSFARENVNLIRDIPERTLTEIEGIAQRGVRGTSQRELSQSVYEQLTRDLKDETDKALKKARDRANLIARDQVGKLNAQLTELRQRSIGVQEYIWQSSADERVRESHRVMDGKICRWDDPTVYREPGETQWRSRSSIGGVAEHPGEDYQCRCAASPQLDDLFAEAGIET